MKRPVTLILAGLASVAAIGHAFRAPFPASGDNPVLDLIAYHDLGFHTVIRIWQAAPLAGRTRRSRARGTGVRGGTAPRQPLPRTREAWPQGVSWLMTGNGS